MVELPGVVIQPEQQRADVRPGAVLVPAEAGNDAVGGALVLDLEHRPLPRLVPRLETLGDDAIEAGALEPIEPVRGLVPIRRRGRQVDRRLDAFQRRFEPGAAGGLRHVTQVLVPDPRDIDRLLEAIERWRVTVFPGVPTLYAAIASHPSVVGGRRDLRSIEACISGAAALPNGTQTAFERLTGGRLVEGYGLSEASPATHCTPLGSGGRSDTIGLPLPDTDCRLVDIETETREVGAGEPGILCVTGWVEVGHVIVLAFLLGVTSSIEIPTRQAFITEMVGPELVPSALGLNASSYNAGRLIGPACAGQLIGLTTIWMGGAVEGTGVAFLINAASYLVVVVGYFSMRPSELLRPPRRAGPRGAAALLGEIGEDVVNSDQHPVVLLLRELE